MEAGVVDLHQILVVTLTTLCSNLEMEPLIQPNSATVMDIGLEICWKLALEFLITFRIAHSKFPSVVILILVPFVSSAV
jgi:hypothetical protein